MARLPIVVDLLEAGAVPRYQRIAEDARRMHALGMNIAEIARALGTDGHMAKKAVRWAVGPDAQEPLRQPARYKQVAEEALGLAEAGWSLRRIGQRLGLSAPMVMRSLTWARSKSRRS